MRLATTTTATVFGNVASEIAGSSVLQPNSPQAIVKTALESANKSRLVCIRFFFDLFEIIYACNLQLARRLFYSFAKPDCEYLFLEDIEKCFLSHEEAVAAYSLFDKDGNGDVSREEIEIACLCVVLGLLRDVHSLNFNSRDFHREQLSIENSMRDLDSAVGRLDNILMSLYFVIAAIVLAVVLVSPLSGIRLFSKVYVNHRIPKSPRSSLGLVL